MRISPTVAWDLMARTERVPGLTHQPGTLSVGRPLIGGSRSAASNKVR